MAKESNKLDAIKVKYLRFDINSAKRQRGPNGGRILPNKQLAPWFHYIYYNFNKTLKIIILQNIQATKLTTA